MTTMEDKDPSQYVGRLAPSPTGLLHVGHASTFGIAQARAKRSESGRLLLRVEDLDGPRCKPQYLAQMLEDMTWYGLCWDNAEAPVFQSQRSHFYWQAFLHLFEKGFLYPSPHSRKDVEKCLSAPHAGDGGEVVFPTELRPEYMSENAVIGSGNNRHLPQELIDQITKSPTSEAWLKTNWRFRVPDGQRVNFVDGNFGPVSFVAGVDFGDFVVWRADNIASYELAVVVDDLEMGVTEVVRGHDLLLSTARQLLLMRELLGLFQRPSPPAYFHCPLVLDKDGKRMAKRCASTTLRGLREEGGLTPAQIKVEYGL